MSSLQQRYNAYIEDQYLVLFQSEPVKVSQAEQKVFNEEQARVVKDRQIERDFLKALDSDGKTYLIKASTQNKQLIKPSNTRWITLENGTHVLIRDNGDGTAYVVGGAGGKLNFLRLKGVKSEDEYKKEQEERKKGKTAEQLKEEKLAKKLAKERKTELDKATAKALLAMQGKASVTEHYDEALSQQRARLETIDDDTEKVKLKKSIQKLEHQRAQAEHLEAKDIIRQAQSSVTNYINDSLDAKALGANNFYNLDDETLFKMNELLERQKKLQKSLKKATKSIDREQAERLIKGEMTLDTRSRLTKLVLIKKGEEKPISGLSLDEKVAKAKELAELTESYNNNVALIESIDEESSTKKQLQKGQFTALNLMSQSILGGETINPDLVDTLGYENASKILAYELAKHNDGHELAESIDNYHANFNQTVVNDALDKGSKFIDEAKAIEVAVDPATADEIYLCAKQTELKKELSKRSMAVMAQALGGLEAIAMLSEQLKHHDDNAISANLGHISDDKVTQTMASLGLTANDYVKTYSQEGDTLVHVPLSNFEKITENSESKEELILNNQIEAIKNGDFDEEGWLPVGVARRSAASFSDEGIKKENSGNALESQIIANTEQTKEAVLRTLAQNPAGRLAFKAAEDLTLKDKVELRGFFENIVYPETKMAETFTMEATPVSEKFTPISKNKAWHDFIKLNGSEKAALDKIKAQMKADAPPTFFGDKDYSVFPALGYDGTLETGRHLLKENGYQDDSKFFNEASSLQAQYDLLTVKNTDQGLLEQKKAELIAAYSALADHQLKSFYYHRMSGYSALEFEAGASRQLGSPWTEYTRVMGGPQQAYRAMQTQLKTKTLTDFAKHYGQITKTPLLTDSAIMPNADKYLMATMSQEKRDRYMAAINNVQASDIAIARQHDEGGFKKNLNSIDWKVRALELKQQRELENRQFKFEENGTEIDKQYFNFVAPKEVTIGARAEHALASIMPEIASNFRGKEQVRLFANLNMSSEKHVQQQRAIKMFAKTKRMNLTFGTGKGKTITSLGAFTHLKAEGAVKRAILAVPSVVQGQFGNEALTYLEAGKFSWKADATLTQAERIEALKNNKLDMVVFTHQSLRDDLYSLVAKRMAKTVNEAKQDFSAMSPTERKHYLKETLTSEGINYDMLVVDESHYDSQRKGKDDSSLSIMMDALNGNANYYMRQSATPVKNDLSEAFDMLQDVAPDKFTDRDAFLKKYGVNTPYAKESLQRLINRTTQALPKLELNAIVS